MPRYFPHKVSRFPFLLMGRTAPGITGLCCCPNAVIHIQSQTSTYYTNLTPNDLHVQFKPTFMHISMHTYTNYTTGNAQCHTVLNYQKFLHVNIITRLMYEEGIDWTALTSQHFMSILCILAFWLLLPTTTISALLWLLQLLNSG